jgi:hypothetical protein
MEDAAALIRRLQVEKPEQKLQYIVVTPEGRIVAVNLNAKGATDMTKLLKVFKE